MKRMAWLVTVIVLALGLGFGAGVRAAGKAYQFTGVVKTNDASGLTVEKSPKETWTFDVNKDTKGTAKVGDRVTVYYTMLASQIEAKPAAAPAATAKKPAGK